MKRAINGLNLKVRIVFPQRTFFKAFIRDFINSFIYISHAISISEQQKPLKTFIYDFINSFFIYKSRNLDFSITRVF